MKLFPGYVDGHNGSYMGNFGLAFHDYRISINLVANGDLTGTRLGHWSYAVKLHNPVTAT